jgi:hypothetical protein
MVVLIIPLRPAGAETYTLPCYVWVVVAHPIDDRDVSGNGAVPGIFDYTPPPHLESVTVSTSGLQEGDVASIIWYDEQGQPMAEEKSLKMLANISTTPLQVRYI